MREDTLHIAEILGDSGRVKARYGRYMSGDGTRWIRHGLFVQYHGDGSVASEGEYVDGLENGPWRDFFENGRVAAEGVYIMGKEGGEWRFYLESGTLDRVTQYVDGQPINDRP